MDFYANIIFYSLHSFRIFRTSDIELINYVNINYFNISPMLI